MAIPTLAVFGTSRTLRGRESKDLTRQPVVVAVAVVVAAVLGVEALLVVRRQQSAAVLLAAEALPVVVLPVEALPVVARGVAQVDRAVALPAAEPRVGELAVAAADGLLIHQTERSHTRRRREPSSKTSSRITWPTSRS